MKQALQPISFQPGADGIVCLEAVFSLMENVHTDSDRLIVVLDEFQEIREMGTNLDKQLRSIMQRHKHISYILLGSQESMMTDIFENKKSPFYHFGEMMRLSKLPRKDFRKYLSERLAECLPDTSGKIADEILNMTDCHPYYSQQRAASVWQIGVLTPDERKPLKCAIEHIVTTHSLDFERLWMHQNRTNKWILRRLSECQPVNNGEYRTSTVYSAFKRLQKDSLVIYTNRYELEDPFFKQWILVNNK